jgi:site-specific DNA-methyltransferase (adenine-specific)
MNPVRIGDATLYCGDALEILPSLGRADAVIADPPYAIPTQVAQTRDVTRSIGDLSMIEASFRLLFDMTLRLTGSQGRHFVFADGSSYPVVFRAMFGKATSALLVWDKGRIGMGREFRKSHELVMHAWGADTPIAQADGVGYADILKCEPLSSDERVHPAQKPVPLIEALLRVCGRSIVDPFMGSGSSAVACINTGRKFTGIEIEPRYFDIACKRIEQAYAQRPLFESAPQPKPQQMGIEA